MGMGLGFNNVNFGSQFGRDTWGRPNVTATPPYFLNQSPDSYSCNNGNNWNTKDGSNWISPRRFGLID
jgi:hypothetical protein